MVTTTLEGFPVSQGNIFSDFESLISEVDITPRQHFSGVGTNSSLPNNPSFNSLLASLAPRLMDAYVVTRLSNLKVRPVHNLVFSL